MDLTGLSGSQAPNAVAIVSLAALTVLAFVMKRRIVGAVFALLAVAFVATVVMKNLAYSAIISGPHAENSMAAHHDYANMLNIISWAQLIVGIILGLGAFAFGRLGWPASMAAFVTAYAMICVDDWRNVYATQDASRPVHYEMVHPWVHWGVIACTALVAVVTIIMFARRPKRTGTRRA